ncbi:MAG TPA: RNA methyltransferase [Anaerolineaceae bacterium]|jgi:TrmH family RNA methyltransferase
MITSRQNPKVQQMKALLGRARERQQAGEFVVEGVRLVEEAAQSGWKAHLVLYTEQLSERGQQAIKGLQAAGAEIEQVAPAVMEAISDTETSQGVLAVFPLPGARLPEHLDFLVLADHLHDPGNLGTLLRTAAAAGVQAVIASPGTADPFSPKVLRAAMGAHFRVPVVEMEWDAIGAALKKSAAGYPAPRVFLAEAEGGQTCWQADLRGPLALVIGSEADGVSAQARALAHASLRIPMPGKSESLNAAVAGAILMFEVVRQRH